MILSGAILDRAIERHFDSKDAPVFKAIVQAIRDSASWPAAYEALKDAATERGAEAEEMLASFFAIGVEVGLLMAEFEHGGPGAGEMEITRRRKEMHVHKREGDRRSE